ncbi:radical SAM protein [Candidatus Woesearchaeota archaeon]|nr:radical SAM protein [Candidatus Woesearchaeota archaeon]
MENHPGIENSGNPSEIKHKDSSGRILLNVVESGHDANIADNGAKATNGSLNKKSAVQPLNFTHHLHKVLNKANQLPSYFIFYPTSRCNLSCKHCFYHDSLNKKFNELTLEEIDKFTKTMDPLLHLILTGGEPYLRHDIDEIVRIFYENTRVPIISIPSNGFFRDRMVQKIRNMMEWCPELVLNQLISLDGLREEHDKIRGPGSFDKSIKTLNTLKELQKEYGRINIGIVTTFTSLNQHNFKEIIKGVFEIAKPDNITITLIRGDPKEKINVNLDISLYREAVKYRDSLFFSKEMPGHIGFKGNKIATAARVILNEKVEQIYQTKQYQMPCYAGNLSGVMYPEGQVHPCEILDNSHALGNIREFNYDFRKLWLSQKAKEEVKFIRGTNCFCTHECFNTVNILFNAKFYPRLIKIASSI